MKKLDSQQTPEQKTRAAPSPARTAAGRKNRARRKGLTDGGRRRLREAALLHRPWTHSTGPRTPEGKLKVAANGRMHRKGETSARERRALMADVHALLNDMSALRRQATSRRDAPESGSLPATRG